MAIGGVLEIFSLFSLLPPLFLIIIIFFLVLFYVYFSLTKMITAKRLNVKHAWLAWIPLVNIYLNPKMAKKPVWPLIFVFISVTANYIVQLLEIENLIILLILVVLALVGAVYAIYWLAKILKRRGKPGWWIVFILFPPTTFGAMFLIWAILAWEKDEKETKSSQDKDFNSNKELVEYLRKYKSEGYTTEELKEHLINSGQSPHDIDEAIKYI